MTHRIVVVGGPWPARIGAEGHIVEPPPGERRYPFAGLAKNEIVIRLDDDPEPGPFASIPAHWWTCVLGRDDVRFLP